MRNYLIFVLLVLTSVFLYILGNVGVLSNWDSPLYYIGVPTFYLISYFFFRYMESFVKFNFREAYVGFILLVALYLGYFLGFRAYYGGIAYANGKAFSDIVSAMGLSFFSSLFSSPYMHLSIAFLLGYLAFCFSESKNRD